MTQNVDIDELVSEFEQTPASAKAMAQARKWLARNNMHMETDPPCTGELPETATALIVSLLFRGPLGDICKHERMRIEAVDFYKDEK